MFGEYGVESVNHSVSVCMSESNEVTTAVKRLTTAIESLDNSVDARLVRETELGEAEAEVQRMGADRARLAVSLDSAEERAQRLEHTNKEVSRRLVDAMESIRAVLEKKQGT